ncbi:hypothetical protein PTKIN_Ptkin12aG0121800 [Pterospermum kingtungense]
MYGELQVDAFADSAFKGNPAAVCFLEEERDEKRLQAVAAEFNISVTCYLTRITVSTSPIPRLHLRWFNPVIEIQTIEFDTLSGILTAKKEVPDVHPTGVSNIHSGGHECFVIELNLPTIPIAEFNSDEVSPISKAVNGAPLIRTTTKDDLFVVLSSGKYVTEMEPRFYHIRKCPGRGIIVSGVAPPDSEFDLYYSLLHS